MDMAGPTARPYAGSGLGMSWRPQVLMTLLRRHTWRQVFGQ